MDKTITLFPYGKVKIPPSKSFSHRAVICDALAGGESEIKNLGISEDISKTIEGIKGLVDYSSDFIDCGESGSTLRFLLPIAALDDKEYTFFGKGKLLERPLNVYEKVFPLHGVSFNKTEKCVTVKGRMTPGIFEIEGDVSSQFISGLLFALPLLEDDSEIILTTKLESKEYVDMTIEMLSKFGIEISKKENGFNIEGNQNYQPANIKIEGDYSQAAFFLVSKEFGCKVECIGLENNSIQGDRKIIDIIKQAQGNAVIVDASDIPDLVPILAVYMCFLKGTSKIVNAGRARIKESDRLHSITTELNKIGANIIEGEDSLTIEGVESFTGGIVDSWNDHRIVMSLAVAAIKCSSQLTITNCEVVNKSYPDFWKDFEKK